MLSMSPTCPVPSADPVPSLTRRFRQAGAFERTEDGALTEQAVAALRGVIQSVVSGLNTDERPFRVIFGKSSTATTNMSARLVYLGTKAMDDRTITDGQLAAIMVGLAYHEVAHINYDREYVKFVLDALAKHPQVGMVADAHNIGQDIRIEDRISDDLPGYADTLPVVVWYITERTGAKADRAKTTGVSASVARNMFFAAVRAPWIVRDWTGSESARIWGDDWATRFAATDKRSVIKDLIAEALDKMGEWHKGWVEPTKVDEPPSPKGEDTDEGDFTDEPDKVSTQQPEPDEDEDVMSPPPTWGEDEPEPEGEDTSEDGEPESEDEDDDSEDEDDESEDGEPTDGEPTDDEDEDDLDDEPTPDAKGSREGSDEEPDDDSDAEIEDGDGTEDKDRSKEWSDGDGRKTAERVNETPEVSADLDIEMPTDTVSIEDLEFPTCAADALTGANDAGYEAMALRVEKSREESATRTISSPGWRSRRVVRKWGWNETPPE